MDPKMLKLVGIICLVVCAVSLFVAYERYQANAGNVRAMNQMRNSSPLGGMVAPDELKPAAPAATKYAILLAIISGAGGIACLVYAKPGPAAKANEVEATP